MLARRTDGAVARLLAGRLLYNLPTITEIRDYPCDRPFRHRALKVQDKTVLLPSF